MLNPRGLSSFGAAPVETAAPAEQWIMMPWAPEEDIQPYPDNGVISIKCLCTVSTMPTALSAKTSAHQSLQSHVLFFPHFLFNHYYFCNLLYPYTTTSTGKFFSSCTQTLKYIWSIFFLLFPDFAPCHLIPLSLAAGRQRPLKAHFGWCSLVSLLTALRLDARWVDPRHNSHSIKQTYKDKTSPRVRKCSQWVRPGQ